MKLPSYGGLMDELNNSIKEWFNADDSLRNKLIILPPGDDDLIETWASENNCYILEEPTRASLLSNKNTYKFEIPTDKDFIVIPRLERWFLRHRNGLLTIQNLFKQIQENNIKCLIGCNSWAHQFLKKALNSQFILPDGAMFEPYDVNRLEKWFKEMAENSDYSNIKFKSTSNGKDVFKKDDSDEFEDNFLKELSAESLGIPWVAWELWRKSLNSENDDSKNSNKNNQETTLWLAALDEFSLPSTNHEEALLTLHALLIHTELTHQELKIVLPAIEHTHVVYLLLNSGFIVQKKNDILTCNIAAYPSIRNALASSGFPMDTL